jgi:ammonia channel protein AmtB
VDGLIAGDPLFFKELAAVLFSTSWAFIFTLVILWIINITPVRVSRR